MCLAGEESAKGRVGVEARTQGQVCPCEDWAAALCDMKNC